MNTIFFYLVSVCTTVIPLDLADSSNFPDNKFTSSASSTGSNPHDARMNGNGWCPGSGASPQYVQIDVGEYRAITMIATLGGTTQSNRVTKFSLMSSHDKTTFKEVTDRASTSTKMVSVITCKITEITFY